MGVGGHVCLGELQLRHQRRGHDIVPLTSARTAGSRAPGMTAYPRTSNDSRWSGVSMLDHPTLHGSVTNGRTNGRTNVRTPGRSWTLDNLMRAGRSWLRGVGPPQPPSPPEVARGAASTDRETGVRIRERVRTMVRTTYNT